MVAQLVKGLKPKKLKIDKVRLNILNVLRAEGRIMIKELNKTTATWKGARPKFVMAIGLDGTTAQVIVGPAGSAKGAQKWGWLNDGTKKNYPITAKNAPFLVFRHGSGFTPKTKVGVLSSSPGANTGSFIKKRQVIHPGIEARNWTVVIVKRRKKPFTKKILKATQV